MTSQNRRKQQRALNKIARELNKNIESDPLWKGRYCVRQYKSWWRPYWEEPDYYVFYAQFIFHDKKTHKTYLTGIKYLDMILFLIVEFGKRRRELPMKIHQIIKE